MGNSRVLALTCLLAISILCLVLVSAAEPVKGYKGELIPGMKYFNFGDVRYMVPDSFPEFMKWPPALMGSLPVSEDSIIFIYEAMNPEGTVALLVAIYADTKQAYILAVQASYMPAGVPAEKWTTDYYIETGLFGRYEQSFVMQKADKIPNLSDWIAGMRTKLNPTRPINPAVWRI